MKILWIGGWSLSPKVFLTEVQLHFPQHEHVCICPTQSILEVLQTTDADSVIGFSLGAFLLLKHHTSINTKQCLLLAPFTDFKKESNQGGRISTAQLKYLGKWLKKDAHAALDDFHKKAQLKNFRHDQDLPYPLEDLLWGIDVLINESIKLTPETQVLPAYIGEEDPLLNPKVIMKAFSNGTILPNIGHHLMLSHLLHVVP